MCSVDAYNKEHVLMTSDASSVGGRPMTSKPSKKALYSLGHTINFIDNWLQCFDDNYHNKSAIYKSTLSDSFKKITK